MITTTRLAGSNRQYTRKGQLTAEDEARFVNELSLEIVDDYAVIVTIEGERSLIVLGSVVSNRLRKKSVLLYAVKSRYSALPLRTSMGIPVESENWGRMPREVAAHLGFCGLTSADPYDGYLKWTDYVDIEGDPEKFDCNRDCNHLYHAHVGFAFGLQ